MFQGGPCLGGRRDFEMTDGMAGVSKGTLEGYHGQEAGFKWSFGEPKWFLRWETLTRFRRFSNFPYSPYPSSEPSSQKSAFYTDSLDGPSPQIL